MNQTFLKLSPFIIFFFIQVILVAALNGLLSGSINVITWDVYGYYVYLPALFNFYDLDTLSFVEHIHFHQYPISTGAIYQIDRFENGNAIPIYTMGISMLLLPFYLLADFFSFTFGFNRDGLSTPYQIGIIAANAFYSCFAIFLIFKILKKSFSKKIIWISIIGIMLGTNYLYYTILEPGMPHVFLFFLYTALLFHCEKWHEQVHYTSAIWIGICLSLLCLSRPSECIAVVIPLFYGVYSWDSLKKKFQLLFEQKKSLFILILTGIIMISPQLMLWKFTSGQWIYNSYAAYGHEFHFTHPHIIEGLFSYRKGWLLYSPMMTIGILGLIPFFKRFKSLFAGVLIFLTLNIYFVLSWHMWWYAGCFGMRAFIQSYAIWLLPFACMVEIVLHSSKKWMYTLGSVFVFFLLLNWFQTWQFKERILALDGITSTFYWNAFGRTKKDIRLNRFLDHDEALKNKSNYPLITLDSLYFGGEIEFVAPKKFSKPIEIKVNSSVLEKLNGNWLNVRSVLKNDGDLFGEDAAKLVVSFEDKNNDVYQWIGVRFQQCIPVGQWTDFDYEVSVPKRLQENDLIKVYIWNLSPDKVFSKGLKLELIQTQTE